MASQPTFTLCPPMPAAGAIHTERILSAKLFSSTLASSELDFRDFDGNMSCRTHKAADHYRVACPDFMLQPLKLKEVIVRACECRAYGNLKSVHADRSGTLEERLARAEKRIAEKRTAKIAVLDRLLQRHMEAKESGDLETAKILATKIEGYDTQLCCTNVAALITAVLFLSYRAGMDSCGVSQHLEGRVKPPAVRQILRRCRILAGLPSTRVALSPEDRAARAAMKAEEKAARKLLHEHKKAARSAELEAARIARSRVRKVDVRAERKRAGLCFCCGNKPPAGFKTCDARRRYMRDWAARRKAKASK